MKVSIIIPTYMEEKYIEKTLKSLEKQSYKNFETIIVDSNSSDKTRKISKKYAKVYNLKKRGIAAGRNHGVKKAKGPILLFLDADTIIERNFLKKAVKHFKNKNIISVLPYMRPINNKYKIFFIWGNLSVRMSMTLGQPMLPTTCILYRKDLFDNFSFNENYVCAEDLDFSLRVKDQGKMIFDKNLEAKTSDRRIKKPGYSLFWTTNIFRMFLKSPSRNYPAIR